MSMADLKVGDKVHVEFDGVVNEEPVSWGDGRLSMTVRIQTPDLYVHDICHSSAVITRTDPLNWPPQLGDVWEAGAHDYTVRKHSWSESVVVTPMEGGNAYSEEYSDKRCRLDAFKALKPVLARRRAPAEDYPF